MCMSKVTFCDTRFIYSTQIDFSWLLLYNTCLKNKNLFINQIAIYFLFDKGRVKKNPEESVTITVYAKNVDFKAFVIF